MIDPLLTMAVTPGTSSACRVCGRPLTASAAEGIGPVCAEKFHIPRGRRPAAPNQLTFEEHHMPDTTPIRYRKLPIEITAIQFTGDNVQDIWDAFGAEGIYGPTEKNPDHLILTTVHGDEAPARAGDWVIPEAQPGRFYPCKPDVFAKTYEPADSTTRPTVAELTKERDALAAALHQLRYGMVRAKGKELSTEYIVTVIDDTVAQFTGTEMEPCDSAEQHARAQRAEATIAAITALHQPVDCGDAGHRCAGCLGNDAYTTDTHPCSTTQLITAAQAREERSPFVWEEVVRRTVMQLETYIAAGSKGVNPHQIIGLLSPTWPDGNYAAPTPAADDAEAGR